MTLRERDSTTQVRVPVDEVSSLVLRLATEQVAWEVVAAKWPMVGAPEAAQAASTVTAEGLNRRCGRFSRPAQPIPVKVITEGDGRRCGHFSRPAELVQRPATQ